MMLEIKIIDTSRVYDFNFVKQAVTYLFFSIIPFLLAIVVSSQMLTDNFLNFEENCNVSFDIIFDLQVIGQVIYNYYILCVLLGGLILLVAIIGSITLTLNMDSNKQIKLAGRQLSRSENFLSFFK
jgi:NADH:ubiquinone oxidoreductase subunit 6 (subunit J)